MYLHNDYLCPAAGHDDLRWVLHGNVVLQPTQPHQADHGLPQRRQQAAGQGLLPLQPDADQ